MSGTVTRRLKHWGWGYEHEQRSLDERRAAAKFLIEWVGFGSTEPELPAPLPELPEPRLTPPVRAVLDWALDAGAAVIPSAARPA